MGLITPSNRAELQKFNDYKPLDNLATWLVFVLYGKVVTLLLTPLAAWLVPTSGVGWVLAIYGVIALADYILNLGTAVACGFWIARAAGNLKVFELDGVKVTPTLAVISWFIPIMNMWWPYKYVCEIYKASDPRSGEGNWKNRPIPTNMRLWWGLWLSNAFVPIVIGLLLYAVMDKTEASRQAQLIVTGIPALISAFTTLLGIQIVQCITRSQHQKIHMLQLQATALAPVAPADERLERSSTDGDVNGVISDTAQSSLRKRC